jgi:DNA mismatch repair protein MutS2
MTHAQKVLEFDAILDRLKQQCETGGGAALSQRLRPLSEAEAVWAELGRTNQAYRLLSEMSPPSLGPVREHEDSLERAMKGGSLGGVEIFEIVAALQAMRSFRAALRNRQAEYPALWAHADLFPDLKTLEDQIFAALEGSGEVKDGASSELARLRQRKQAATSRILDRIQSYTSGKHRELLSDPIYTVRDGRYVIPLKVENKGKVRGIVHDTSGTGQTVFIEPEDVLKLGNELRIIEAAEREEVRRILAELSFKIGQNANAILEGTEAASELDLLLAKARLAFEMKAALPERWQGHGLKVQAGRHPLLETGIVVPIDLSVGFDSQGLLITGPNTGGKTVAIKMVGLFVLMAQSGMFLPAIEVKFAPFTGVWADIGDEQSVEQSLSTFSGHIKNLVEALTHLKPGALVLCDEIGAGTDPAEGAALAKAILLTLKEKGAYCIASTHYGELKAFAYNTPGFENASMEFDVKSLRPTYRVLMGAPGASHALRIAERYGLPKEVVSLAYGGLSAEEQQVTKMMEQLELSQRHARIAQGEADRRIAEARKAEERANKKLQEADEIRMTVHQKAAETIEAAVREIRSEASSIFADLKASGVGGGEFKARERLRDLEKGAQKSASEFQQKRTQSGAPAQGLERGMAVRVQGYAAQGVVLEPPNGNHVRVQIGALKINAALSAVSRAEQRQEPLRKASSGNINLQRAQTAVTEIHLRAMRAEDALQELERFLDDAVLAGLPQIRIVHGKGEGILRKITQDYLKRSRSVERFREGEAGEGGAGVTIAYLK